MEHTAIPNLSNPNSLRQSRSRCVTNLNAIVASKKLHDIYLKILRTTTKKRFERPRRLRLQPLIIQTPRKTIKQPPLGPGTLGPEPRRHPAESDHRCRPQAAWDRHQRSQAGRPTIIVAPGGVDPPPADGLRVGVGVAVEVTVATDVGVGPAVGVTRATFG